jgi:hypothetical protein
MASAELKRLIANMPSDQLSRVAKLAFQAMALRPNAQEAAGEICLAALCNYELWCRGHRLN